MIAGEPGGLVDNVLSHLRLRAKRANILPHPAVPSLATAKENPSKEPMHADRPRWLVYLGTFLTAASELGVEVAWTQILSVMSWHHFTYMIISIAILGFGSAGSYLAFQGPKARHGFGDLSRYAFAYSLSIVASLLLVTRIDFDALLITKSINELLKLLAVECLLATPFFFAGLTLSHIITRFQ